jgi:CRISPR/Cas system-associated exonuclease Cas4 (RecB family)
MGKLKNEFSWSKSRNDIFRECHRKYYYTYYGHWGGWEFDAPDEVRQIYILGKLKNRYMWAGAVVHNSIKNVLEETKSGRVPLMNRLIGLTREQMRYDFESSKNKRYWQDPKSCALFEHEYDVEVKEERWKDLWNHVETCIQNFYSSDIFDVIKNIDFSLWLPIEEFQGFLFEDTKINVKLDFAYRDRNGGITIIDWKTGKSELAGSDVQLACYTLFAIDQWNVSPEKVRTIEYNLHHKRGITNRLDAGEIEEIKGYMRKSIEGMKALLINSVQNIASKDSFAKTINQETCSFCNFRRVCLSEV